MGLYRDSFPHFQLRTSKSWHCLGDLGPRVCQHLGVSTLELLRDASCKQPPVVSQVPETQCAREIP